MTDQSIPEREPISDRVSAVVTRIDESALLSHQRLGTGHVLAQGDLAFRFAITYLGKPHLSIVPDLVVADYGEMLVGEAMWQFLMQSAHLYPRADACGLSKDGVEEMVLLKQLDFDHPYDVLVYRQDSDLKPLARVSAIIARDQARFPQRLLDHLPRYDSLNAWRANG